MSFRDHIRACNNYDPARAVPLFAGDDRVGLLRRDNAAALRRFPDVFAVEPTTRCSLLARGDVAAVSRAVDEVVDALVVEKRVPKWRNETFDVAPRWGAPPVFRLDRGAVPFFGTRAYGVHLNGYRRDGGYAPSVGRPAGARQAGGARQARQPRRRRHRQRPRARRNLAEGGRGGGRDPGRA